MAEDKAFLADEYGVRGELQQRIDWLTYAVAGLLTEAPEPESLRDSIVATAADGTPTPVLLIAAGDVETEPLAASYLQQAAPDTVHVWTVPDTGHTQGLSTHGAEWEQRVIGFLDAALLKASD